jgi:hypothetical protein
MLTAASLSVVLVTHDHPLQTLLLVVPASEHACVCVYVCVCVCVCTCTYACMCVNAKPNIAALGKRLVQENQEDIAEGAD